MTTAGWKIKKYIFVSKMNFNFKKDFSNIKIILSKHLSSAAIIIFEVALEPSKRCDNFFDQLDLYDVADEFVYLLNHAN